MAKKKRSPQVAILPHWRDSADVLLKALVANGGDLVSAVVAAGGQMAVGKEGPESLHFWRSRVTDEGMEAFAGFTGVTQFESGERMTDAMLVHLRDMTGMKRMTVNETRIVGDGLRHLAGMTNLEALQLWGCTLTDAAMAHLPRLPALTMLNLSSSSGCTTECLECLTRLENLTSFSLNGAPAAGAGLRHLAALPWLAYLDLSSSGERITTDADLAHLPTLSAVETLSLRYTLVTDDGLRHLSRLPNLRSVELEMTEVGDAGVRHLAALPNLQSVTLNYTKVTLKGVRELQAARPGVNVSARDCAGVPKTEPEPAVLIRRPERREAAPVAASWARIEEWFAANLPAALATLRPPASPADLDALEQRIGRPLPSDFRASYLIHDGQDYGEEVGYGLGVLFGMAIEPISDGEGVRWLYEHRTDTEWRALGNYELDWVFWPPDAMRPAESGPGWVPFFWDSGRNFIGIDLDPGPNGVVGQVIPFGSDDEFRPVLALSFAHLLEDVADELEAGSAFVGQPEVSEAVFGLRGAPRGYFRNGFKQWAEAKLPFDFQQAKALPRHVPEDHATPIGEPLRSQLVGVLTAFFSDMNSYERRWLAVRPIHDYGVNDLQETSDGIVGWSHRGPMPGETPANAVQAVLWDEKSLHDEQTEALGAGKHWKQAVAEKRKIWRKHLTPGERPFSTSFIQSVPPSYDPAAVVDPDVRLVAEGHAIVTFGEPRPAGTCGGTGRVRWHLRLHRGKWRVERHEGVDDPSKPWKLDLV